MISAKGKKVWADPNREGRGKESQSRRFCSRCGNTVQQVRIYKSLNLCELCIKELTVKRDGVYSCRGCGKVAPEEVKAHHGYCSQCVCQVCGQPDPDYVRKTGICLKCASSLGDFCRNCGKEATAQVKKNRGFCDQCSKSHRVRS
jgi:hypothetical protein